MKIESHTVNNLQIAEVISDKLIIENAEDGLNLLGNLYYQGFESIIIHVENITPAFFDLKNKMAGEILQKFSNYRVRLAIIGDFSDVKSNSLKSFIYESNKSGNLIFTDSTEKALTILLKN